MSLLEAENVSMFFGAMAALSDVSITLARGEILGIIGPNGSGKTTMFNVMVGKYRPGRGKVIFDGRDITGYPTHAVCRLGLVKTAQIVQPFTSMSVRENVWVGGLYGRAQSLAEARRSAAEILEFVGLSDVAHRPAGSLTVAMRRRLELARALATGPKVILLDENMAGLTPTEIEKVLELLREINRLGVSLMVVEHIMQAVVGISHRVVALDYGEKICEGPPGEVLSDKRVCEAYLGDHYA